MYDHTCCLCPQHPALTAGQKRYLCSIANVYSTEHMRLQMKRHYLNVLRTCVQAGVHLDVHLGTWTLLCISCCVLYIPGQNPTCRRRCGDHQYKENGTFTKDAEMDVTRTKQQGQRKSNNSSSTANSDVILPKIVNR